MGAPADSAACHRLPGYGNGPAVYAEEDPLPDAPGEVELLEDEQGTASGEDTVPPEQNAATPVPDAATPEPEQSAEPEQPAEHWAQQYYDSLIDKGVRIDETRFDDKITRGEVFALLDRITN